MAILGLGRKEPPVPPVRETSEPAQLGEAASCTLERPSLEARIAQYREDSARLVERFRPVLLLGNRFTTESFGTVHISIQQDKLFINRCQSSEATSQDQRPAESFSRRILIVGEGSRLSDPHSVQAKFNELQLAERILHELPHPE